MTSLKETETEKCEDMASVMLFLVLPPCNGITYKNCIDILECLPLIKCLVLSDFLYVLNLPLSAAVCNSRLQVSPF